MGAQHGLHRSYDFHGVSLEVQADRPGVVDSIDSRLRSFRAETGQSSQIFIDVTTAGCSDIRRPPGWGRPVYDPPLGEITYSDDENILFIRYGGGDGDGVRALCRPERGTAEVAVGRPDPLSLWAVTHPIFTVLLVELLKRRALFSVHAGCVSVEGKALLLAGESGAGKTTLALALLRAGHDFLADDTIFLAHRSHGLTVLSFPDEIDVTDGTIGLFPELSFLLESPRAPGATKRQVRAETVYPMDDPAATYEPSVLVFPRVTGEPHSELTEMEPGEALVQLAPNVLLTDAASSQAHLDALAALVKASRCYRLDTGRDLDALAELLPGLVAG